MIISANPRKKIYLTIPKAHNGKHPFKLREREFLLGMVYELHDRHNPFGYGQIKTGFHDLYLF